MLPTALLEDSSIFRKLFWGSSSIKPRFLGCTYSKHLSNAELWDDTLGTKWWVTWIQGEFFRLMTRYQDPTRWCYDDWTRMPRRTIFSLKIKITLSGPVLPSLYKLFPVISHGLLWHQQVSKKMGKVCSSLLQRAPLQLSNIACCVISQATCEKVLFLINAY